MNDSILSSPDMLLILVALVVSFALGGAYRLGRTAARERRAVDLTDQDLRALSDRYENQQRNVKRLTRELSDVRQALMQQAMAMGPVHAALRVHPVGPAAGASPPAPSTPASAAPVQAAPAPAAPAPAAPVQAAPIQVPRAPAAPVAAAPAKVAAPPATRQAPQAAPQTAARAVPGAGAQPARKPTPGKVSGPAARAIPAAPAATPRPAPPKPAPRKATPMELARAGATAQILMARCGLSRAEAELVISVHGTVGRSAA